MKHVSLLLARSGPLSGVKIIEIAGIGPSPFAGMLLSDMGADIVRIDRPGARKGLFAETMGGLDKHDLTNRNRRSVAINLKHPDGRDLLIEMAQKVDVLQEGSRPGVMERLGLGPDVLLSKNPRLIYARMTGWGQTGPLSQAAGHDINYIALSSALFHIGPKDGKPTPPLNLVGDFAGGAYLAMGICAALTSKLLNGGKGQVIDCAMTDVSASLMAMIYGFMHGNTWNPLLRGSNVLDGGAQFYDTYETKDGKFVAIGSIEPKFYALLLEKTGLQNDSLLQNQGDFKNWPKMKVRQSWFLTNRFCTDFDIPGKALGGIQNQNPIGMVCIDGGH